MRNREALLQAAKTCLLEKGLSRTTARDLATAANVSLAAIGYHFRSKEALLSEAMLLAFEDWNQHFRSLLTDLPPGSQPAARFEAVWTRLISTFEANRPLWRANYEIFSQFTEHPEIGEALRGSLPVVRHMLASLFLGIPEGQVTPEMANSVGAFHHVLLSGMIGQWLVDADRALSAKQLTDALRLAGSQILASPKRKRQTRRKQDFQ